MYLIEVHNGTPPKMKENEGENIFGFPIFQIKVHPPAREMSVMQAYRCSCIRGWSSSRGGGCPPPALGYLCDLCRTLMPPRIPCHFILSFCDFHWPIPSMPESLSEGLVPWSRSRNRCFHLGSIARQGRVVDRTFFSPLFVPNGSPDSTRTRICTFGLRKKVAFNARNQSREVGIYRYKNL